MKTYKFRLYPNKTQERILIATLATCNTLYNACLTERINLHKQEQKNTSAFSQMQNLARLNIPDLDLVYMQVLQQVIHRLDFAFKGFFKRVKQNENPGFPRFKSVDRFNSFCYPQLGFKLCDTKHLKLSKIGIIKIKIHQPIDGEIKTVIVKQNRSGQWFACFTVTTKENPPKVDIQSKVGIDVGCVSFATLNDGTKFEHPHYYRKMEQKLVNIQQRYSKIKPENSDEIKCKLKRKLNRLHDKVANQRNDFLHKLSHKLVTTYDLICIENLDIKSMTKNSYRRLNKSIHDSSWHQFGLYLSYKAENAGKHVVKVDAAYTTQTCSCCGTHVKLKLNQRTFHCPDCHLLLDRDVNAAINILNLGVEHHDKTSRWHLIVDQIKADQLKYA